MRPVNNRSPYLVALGANPPGFGAAACRLARARAALGRGGMAVRAASALWRTPAFPPGAGPDFANAVLMVDGPPAPEAMLARLHRIEAALGRRRRRRWGPRAIDLDLLAAGALVRPDAATARAWMRAPGARQRLQAPRGLVLPHPRLHARAFVLAPLAEVAPGWRHPVTGASAREMLAALPPHARAGVRRTPLPWGLVKPAPRG